MIYLKRAYEAPEESDGRRFLVDRLWPRGIRKESLKLDGWLKEISPSPELRRWFSHEEARWPEFERRYRAELDQNTQSLQPLLAAARAGDITLVYGARDQQHNSAVILKGFLESLLSD